MGAGILADFGQSVGWNLIEEFGVFPFLTKAGKFQTSNLGVQLFELLQYTQAYYPRQAITRPITPKCWREPYPRARGFCYRGRDGVTLRGMPRSGVYRLYFSLASLYITIKTYNILIYVRVLRLHPHSSRICATYSYKKHPDSQPYTNTICDREERTFQVDSSIRREKKCMGESCMAAMANISNGIEWVLIPPTILYANCEALQK